MVNHSLAALLLTLAMPAFADHGPAWDIDGGTAFRRSSVGAVTKGDVKAGELTIHVELDGRTKTTAQISAFGKDKKKPVWTVKERTDYVRVFPDDLLVTTELVGGATQEASLRAYSLKTGKLLFPYSLWFNGGRPIVVRRGGQLRYIGYHGNVGPVRDAVSKATTTAEGYALAGRLFIAGPEGGVEKARVFFDPAVVAKPKLPRKLLLTTATGHVVSFKVDQEWKDGDVNADPRVDVDGTGEPLETSSLALVFDQDGTQSIIVPLPDGKPRLDAAVVGGKAYPVILPGRD